MLHGGATAVFRVGSIGEAVRLAAAVAAVPGLAGSGALLTIADTALTVRLSRDVWKLEPQHVELARSVSAVARAHGAVADRAAVQEVQFAVAAKPDAIDVGFWRAVLGYDPMADDNGVDPLGHGSTVWMQDLDEAKPLRHAMHIDVSVAREHAEARLAAALAAGGRIVDDSGAPGSLDPRRSRRQPRLHRRVAGRGHGPATIRRRRRRRRRDAREPTRGAGGLPSFLDRSRGVPMCCLIAALFMFGPRAAILVWWLIEPVRWSAGVRHVPLAVRSASSSCRGRR